MGETGLVWDWHLHCPVIVSNAVFRTLLLDDQLVITDSSTSKVKQIQSRFRYTAHQTDITGGIVEGVGIPPALQLKTQTWIEDTDINVFVVNQDRTLHSEDEGPNPQIQAVHSGDEGDKGIVTPAFAIIEDKGNGLLKLKLTESDQVDKKLTCDGVYLSSDRFTKGVPNLKTGHVLPFPNIDQQDVLHYNTKVNLWSHSYAFRCPQWPKAAMEWITRSRKHEWPSAEVIDKVKSEGCYVVPASTTSWRYSFTMAERRLMSSLSPTQKHVFTLLKIIWFQKLGSPRVLQMHHLRANFLRLCEEVRPDLWRPDQTTALLMHCLDSLLHQLISGEFPDYFIPNRNLLQGISEDFLDETQVALADARSEALNIFIQYNLSFQFETNTGIESGVFQPILDVTESRVQPKNEILCILEVLVPFLIRLMISKAGKGTELTKDIAFEKIGIFRMQIENLMKETGGKLSDQIWNFIATQVHQNIQWGIFFYEYVLEKVGPQDKHTLMGNLGCMYHAMYTAGKETYKSKARDMFEAAIKEPTVTSSTRADYVVFLRHTQDWKRAKDLIIEVISSNDIVAANSYDSTEIQTLHPDLETMAEALGGQIHTVPAVAHMYFLYLTEDQLSTDEKTKKETIQGFKNFCDKPKQETDESFSTTSHALLGLAMGRMERKDEAVKAYQTALDVAPNEKWEVWLSDKLISYGEEPRLRQKENTKKTEEATAGPVAEEEEEGEANDDFFLKGDENEGGENENDEEEGEVYDEEKALREALQLSLIEQSQREQIGIAGAHNDPTDEEDEEEMLKKALELSMQIT